VSGIFVIRDSQLVSKLNIFISIKYNVLWYVAFYTWLKTVITFEIFTVEPDLCVYGGEEKILFITLYYLEIIFR
jgi:hypothetical protein